MKSNTIAVIGLGAIGYGVAASLGAERLGGRRRRHQSLRRRSALRASSGSRRALRKRPPRALTSSFSIVVSAAQCEAILFGDGGVLASTAPDALIISCVTMDPAQARSIGAKVEATGRAFVDAPTSGGPARAAEGRDDPSDAPGETTR